jgi:plasmid stabilization system protein ParE
VTYRVRRHIDVERDILDLAMWIARDSRDAAIRFFDAVETGITSLRSMPGKGSPKHLRGRLSDVRSWAVGGFPNHLILYDIRGSDVFVLAVIHGARNYVRLLRGRARVE